MAINMPLRHVDAVEQRVAVDLISLVERVRLRALAARGPVESIIPPAGVLSAELPNWPVEVRGVFNEILRSALFNACNRNQPRRNFKNESIGTVERSTEIRYTGEELRQTDETYFLQLLHYARARPIGSPVEFTPYSFIKATRLANSKQNSGHVDRLLESLRRMQATALSIYSKRMARGVSISMIPAFQWCDEATGARLHQWRVVLAPELVELYGTDHFAHIHWQQRLRLPTGLATWLHGYFSSHREPYAVKISTLQRACGCITDEPRKFRQLVHQALKELEAVQFLRGDVRGEHVHVTRF
jgi:hypothetical protein